MRPLRTAALVLLLAALPAAHGAAHGAAADAGIAFHGAAADAGIASVASAFLAFSPFRFFASSPPDPLIEDYRFGSFRSAHALSVNQFGEIFVTDRETGTVSKWTLDGTKQAEIGGPGWDVTQFLEPHGIDASLGVAVYVADWGNHRVTRLDRNLNVQATLTTFDDPTQTVGFGYPLDVVSSEFDNLFILDGEDQRVVSVVGFSTVNGSFGGVESGAGRLRAPVAMAQDRKSRLYVLEDQRVVSFDTFGNFRSSFGEAELRGARGIGVLGDRVAVVTPDALHLFRADGTVIAQWQREDMVLADRAGEFRDVVLLDDAILLLTEETLIIFRHK